MEYKDAYIQFLRKAIDVRKPMTVVFDASNGPAGMLMEDLWKGTNIKAVILHDDIDPDFKGHGPNPMVSGASAHCAKAVIENKADLGIMFDADGDRAVFLDGEGNMIHACFMSALMFKESKPPYVMDELIYQSVKLLGIIPEMDILPSRIGAAFLKKIMRNQGASVGAEYSGHYFFREFFNADSGIFAAIKVLNCLSKMDQSFLEWKRQFPEHIITSKEIRTEGKDMPKIYADIEKEFASLARIEKRDGLTLIFDTYWISVRSSNTEPIMRIIAGGTGDMQKQAEKLEKMVEAVS